MERAAYLGGDSRRVRDAHRPAQRVSECQLGFAEQEGVARIEEVRGWSRGQGHDEVEEAGRGMRVHIRPGGHAHEPQVLFPDLVGE